MNHFPAALMRIRVLRKKREDTLAAETEQCVGLILDSGIIFRDDGAGESGEADW